MTRSATADVGVVESYCGACERWSPDSEWIERNVVWGETTIEGHVECPGFGHRFHPCDPPMRNRP